MKPIESFCIDHNTLKEGIYISRIDKNIITYDLRFCRPNNENYLANSAIHTIEHIFATFVRNTPQKDHIIYFGPMGCRTGFYFITRDLAHEQALPLIKGAVLFVRDFEGNIPGSSAKECGNCLEHDLFGAKAACKSYYQAVKNWSVSDLHY